MDMTEYERMVQGLNYDPCDEKIMEEQAARGTDAKYAECLERHPGKRKSIFGRIFGFLP